MHVPKHDSRETRLRWVRCKLQTDLTVTDSEEVLSRLPSCIYSVPPGIPTGAKTWIGAALVRATLL